MTRIQELQKLISEASNNYYNHTPTVSDITYDAWVYELSNLDPSNPSITSIGAIPVSEWKKVEHVVPMQSLSKAQNEEQFLDWAKESGATEFFLTLKLDGVSVNLTYENDNLLEGSTRGSGAIGEDITVNVAKMGGTNVKAGTANYRGEIILKKTKHKQHFEDYANPRNAASGISKRYDGEGCQHLDVMVYSHTDAKFKTEAELFDNLKRMGFNIPPYELCSASQVIQIWKDYQQTKRDQLDYDIDGLVIKVNDLEKQYALGEKNHRPKGAIAFKFDAASCETTLTNTVWQVGPTGRVTPVGIFDEIDLCGVKVSRASLHNYSNILDLGLSLGCRIIVSRRNDVIPYIEEVVSNHGGRCLEKPSTCPECASNLSDAGEYIVCTNEACPAKVLGRISRWIDKNGMLDVGDKVLQKMIDAGLISDIGDLYRVTAEQIAGLDRMGERSAANIVAEIEKHREVTLANFIGSLGINCIGNTASSILIDAGYDTLDKLQSISIRQACCIPGFGDIRATDFVNGMRDNKDRIADILAAGVTIKSKTIGCLSGKSFCFTGASELPRKKLHALVEENGGTIKKSVGKGLDYLVSSDDDGENNKSKAARKNGTQVITEGQFMGMLG